MALLTALDPTVSCTLPAAHSQDPQAATPTPRSYADASRPAASSSSTADPVEADQAEALRAMELTSDP